jgi:hypothetical protein
LCMNRGLRRDCVGCRGGDLKKSGNVNCSPFLSIHRHFF